jgi:uncharacterized protein (TIGR01777 family)
MPVFNKRQYVDVPREELFNWHGRYGAIGRLVPPWEHAAVLERLGGIADGSVVRMEVKAGPIKKEWLALHRGYKYPERFCDVMERGPFKAWEHNHVFHEKGAGSEIEDLVLYELPLSPLSDILAGRFVREKLESMFSYRHRVTVSDLEFKKRYNSPKLNLVVSGASGQVGRCLVPFLTTQGHSVKRLVRRQSESGFEFSWNPDTCEIDNCFGGCDAVIHLAGEPIGEGRWTEKKKKRITASRVEGTKLIAEFLAGMDNPPRTLICASAIGYYGDGGEAGLDEDSPLGDSFIADVCRQWEEAAKPAAAKGIRVVFARIGVALTPSGGALQRFLPAFRSGFGCTLGSGRQFLSWAAMDDVIYALTHCIYTDEISGPVNIVSPNPLRMDEFSSILGKVLHRPSFFRVPEGLLRFVFGQMGQEVLIGGAKVLPKKLLDSGFIFSYPEPEKALRHLLGRMK